MASYNKVIMIGNLTRDPEKKTSKDGMPICKFDIAVNNRGGGKEEVLFIKVSAFSKIAENCGQYLQKGSSVLVDGRLKSDTWEADDGTKRTSIEIVANSVTFLSKAGGSREEAAEEEEEKPSRPASKPAAKPTPKPDSKPAPKKISKTVDIDDIVEDDIPF
jgi:single-strand DNA-binding protein